MFFIYRVEEIRVCYQAYADLSSPFWSSDSKFDTEISDFLSAHDAEFSSKICRSMQEQCNETAQRFVRATNLFETTGQKVFIHLPQFISKYNIPILADMIALVFFNVALPFYLLLAILIVAIIARRRSKISDVIFISAPAWATLASLLVFAPVASFRYAAEMYYALPILAIYAVYLLRYRRSAELDSVDKTAP